MEASALTRRRWLLAAREGGARRGARAPRRLASLLALGALPVALISTLIIFLLTYLSTANPAAQKLGETATPEAIARLNHLWGLDKPFFAQYFSWLGHALQGDLGRSYFTDIPVSTSIAQRLPVDLSITVVALLLAIAIGFGAGIAAAVWRGRAIDRLVTALSSVAVTVPVFWLGIMLVILFAVKLGWLPATGYEPLSAGFWAWLSHALLPGFALSLSVAAVVARQLRNSLVATLEENFVVGATVRGLSRRRILLGHALRNAAAPAVASIGLELPQLLGAAVVTETIFALPGIGEYALNGAQTHDVPVIQGVLLVMVVIVLVCNIGVDALLAWLRPATRRG